MEGTPKKRRIVKEKEAALYMNVSVALLQRDRWRGGDIPFLRVAGAIRFDLDQLDRYMDESGNGKEVQSCS
jgi:hypothetical protein